jgi:Protein of unknown function (DUF2510)
MTRPGWYDSPDGQGSRWWTGQAWTSAISVQPPSALRLIRRALLIAAVALCVFGTLLTGPQTFGVVMVNFDEHVVDARAALTGLYVFAVLALVLLGIGIAAHVRRSQSPAGWRVSTVALLAAIGVEMLSIIGVTEHAGLLLFG